MLQTSVASENIRTTYHYLSTDSTIVAMIYIKIHWIEIEGGLQYDSTSGDPSVHRPVTHLHTDQQLALCCGHNNLELNTLKAVAMTSGGAARWAISKATHKRNLKGEQPKLTYSKK